MRKFSFSSGPQVRIGSREYTLIAPFVVDDHRWWELRPIDSTIGEKFAESELQRLYVSGELGHVRQGV
jgi:hypothetical protein